MSDQPRSEKPIERSEPSAAPAESAARTLQARKPVPAKGHLPQFRVILHNDDFNEMRYVVRTIIDLTRLDSGRAIEIMMTAHKRGAAQVLVTHKERAELYKDQFAGRRLKVSIEPTS